MMKKHAQFTIAIMIYITVIPFAFLYAVIKNILEELIGTIVAFSMMWKIVYRGAPKPSGDSWDEE